MVKVKNLIDCFRLMYEQHWEYVWGSATKGTVDCSGAFVYAFRLYGVSVPHGSNALARRYTVKLLPITEAKPGMIAFKAKTPKENGYDLPDKYAKGGSSSNGDYNDYYHVGLVDEDPRYVLNAKGTSYGFCRDALTVKNGWDYVAYMNNVDYGETEEMDTAKVVLPSTASGNSVNMRRGASRNDSIVATVPVGSTVQIVEDTGAWCKIIYQGKTGWMMSNYLEYAGMDGESSTSGLTDQKLIIIDQALTAIEDAIQTVQKAVDSIGSVVGRG